MNRSGANLGRVSWRLLLLVLVLAVAGGAVWFWRDFNRFGVTPLHVSASGESIDIGRGTSFKDIVHQLRAQGLSTSTPLYWRLLAERMHVAGRLHAGEYAIVPGITPTVGRFAMCGRLWPRRTSCSTTPRVSMTPPS
jgi:UPF0755 protein